MHWRKIAKSLIHRIRNEKPASVEETAITTEGPRAATLFEVRLLGYLSTNRRYSRL